jgi:hypothetical protein
MFIGPGSFLFGEGRDVGFLLFPVCSQCVLTLFQSRSEGVPNMFIMFPVVPYFIQYPLDEASTHLSNSYHSTFAASILIILFSEMLKFSEYFLKEKCFVKENIESSGIFYLLKRKFQRTLSMDHDSY